MHFDRLIESHRRIQPFITRTALTKVDILGRELYLKCENLQVTGSAKLRGCLNLLLQDDQSHYISRSSGNFAGALAWAGKTLGIPVTVVMPNTAPLIKITRASNLGARVILSGPTHAEGDKIVEEIAASDHLKKTSPFDDDDVIAGHASIAFEIFEELPSITHFFCPVGGGGLMSGSALAFHVLNPKVNLIAVEPETANDLFLSLAKNERVVNPPANTIADGLRTPSVGEKNWPHLQRLVNEVHLVSDAEIIQAMQALFETTGMIAEPSGAAALAAALKADLEGPVVVLISGGNVDLKQFTKWTLTYETTQEGLTQLL